MSPPATALAASCVVVQEELEVALLEARDADVQLALLLVGKRRWRRWRGRPGRHAAKAAGVVAQPWQQAARAEQHLAHAEVRGAVPGRRRVDALLGGGDGSGGGERGALLPPVEVLARLPAAKELGGGGQRELLDADRLVEPRGGGACGTRLAEGEEEVGVSLDRQQHHLDALHARRQARDVVDHLKLLDVPVGPLAQLERDEAVRRDGGGDGARAIPLCRVPLRSAIVGGDEGAARAAVLSEQALAPLRAGDTPLARAEEDEARAVRVDAVPDRLALDQVVRALVRALTFGVRASVQLGVLRGSAGLRRCDQARLAGVALLRLPHVALLPLHVGVVGRVAPRPRLAAGRVAAVVVAAQASVGVVKDGHGVVPRHLLGPSLAGPSRLGVINFAAVISAVRLLEALARVVEAVPAIPVASLDVTLQVARAVVNPLVATVVHAVVLPLQLTRIRRRHRRSSVGRGYYGCWS
mmetsp:Transcript_6479/g.18667  ORF Transcript_6479/g.18667 Transcript_6479/m.18667 type:complete len:469 (-) Transcript_6479:59-1465(-)